MKDMAIRWSRWVATGPAPPGMRPVPCTVILSRVSSTARWIASDDPAKLKAFQSEHRGASATDRDGAPVFMAKDGWEVGYITQRNPDIRFTATKERRLGALAE